MIISKKTKRRKVGLREERGGITIFLSITLLVMITLTGVLVEGARIRTAETTVKRITDNALHSALSHYDKTLKEEYGLFALAIPEAQLEEFLKEYFDKAIKPMDFQKDNESYWELHNLNIEELMAVGQFSLGEDAVLRQQILEYMKYRGPKKIAEEFLEKLVEIAKASEVAEVMQEKLDVEGELINLAYLEKDLEELIQQAKDFNYNDESGEVINTRLATLISLDANLDDMEDELSNLEAELLREKSEKKIKELEKSISDLKSSISYQYSRIDTLDGQLSAGINALFKKLKELRDANSKINSITTDIKVQAELIKNKLEAIKQKLEKQPKDDTADTHNKILEEIEDYIKATNKIVVGDIDRVSGENTNHLQEAIKPISSIKSIVSSNSVGGYWQLKTSIADSVKTYQASAVEYSTDLTYEKWQLVATEEGEVTAKDIRKESAEKANELLGKKSEQDIVISKNLQQILPSQIKEKVNTFPTVEFEYSKRDSGYTTATLQSMKSILEGVIGLGEGIGNELLVNEYVLGTFNNRVTDQEGYQYNLRNELKSSRGSFFDREVEYILHGNASQQENVTATEVDLLMLRFVINLIYVYNDPQLLKTATILATSLAAPIGPAAMPIIKTLILGGWAMNYSMEDVKSLVAGEEVNFYRTKEHLKFNYEDYLRILLLKPTLKASTKLDRIKDLIQLNLQKNSAYGESFLIGKSKTYIKVNLTYSFKVLFFGQVQKGEKLDLNVSNRNYYKLEQLQGY